MHTRGFKSFEVRYIKAAIARATGDHDRAGLDAFLIKQIQHETVRVRIIERLQPGRLIRDRHFRAKFLRLIVGARHEGHAANSGRKAQIVFDPGGGAGLPTKGAAIKHENDNPSEAAYTAVASPAGP